MVGGIGAIGGVIGLLRLLADVNMDSLNRFGMAVWLWPVATPVLWLVETALLSFAYRLCAKLSTVRAMWIASAFASVAVVGAVSWVFWTSTVDWVSVS